MPAFAVDLSGSGNHLGAGGRDYPHMVRIVFLHQIAWFEFEAKHQQDFFSLLLLFMFIIREAIFNIVQMAFDPPPPPCFVFCKFFEGHKKSSLAFVATKFDKIMPKSVEKMSN